MLDNTHCFFIVGGSANCLGTLHVMFVVPFFSFLVVLECISSNIVNGTWLSLVMRCKLSFFVVHIKLVLPKFQVAPCYAKISS